MKFLTLGLALLYLCFAQASRFEVRVAEKSTVRVGDPVRLGALLAEKFENPGLESRIYDLVVLEPLTSEGEKVYQSEELALILRQKLSYQDLKRISVKIPEQFTVRAKRNFLYQSDISREIFQQSRSLCEDCTFDLSELKVPEIPPTQEIMQLRLDVQSLQKAGSFVIPLAVHTSQGKSVYWVTGKVHFYKTAPVVKRLIRPNEVISAQDFDVKKIDVSFAKDGVPQSEDLIGKVATRVLTVGQPVFSGDVRREIAVHRGQAVKIIFGSEVFEVIAQGTAEESGSLGDRIKVKSADTKKMLSGLLVEHGTVKVE